MTRSEIIARLAEQKARKAEVLEFPSTTVNGHAADGGLVTFARAQTAKENWLAALRKLEYQTKCGELIPVSYVRQAGVTFLTEARDVLLRGPSELADALAAEVDPVKCESLLHRWVERVMERFYQTEKLWGGGEGPKDVT